MHAVILFISPLSLSLFVQRGERDTQKGVCRLCSTGVWQDQFMAVPVNTP